MVNALRYVWVATGFVVVSALVAAGSLSARVGSLVMCLSCCGDVVGPGSVRALSLPSCCCLGVGLGDSSIMMDGARVVHRGFFERELEVFDEGV